MIHYLQQLQNKLVGEFYFDESPIHQSHLLAYATDASVYQEKPLAVALPKNEQDIVLLIDFANQHHTTLMPRAAGTSLAGQVVGYGIVVDISKYFNDVLELNTTENWVRVQPGVIRDDLNKMLQPYGLMFGPETSTTNRAMIGGMVGNNSCGLHSIVWGSVRDHLLEATMLLHDGSKAVINSSTSTVVFESNNNTFNTIKQHLHQLLNNGANQQAILHNFPKQTVVRRNTGYALDALLQTHLSNGNDKRFNICSLLAGSEGTLGILTEVKLQLLPLPPKNIALVCIHCTSIKEALQANTVALMHSPMAAELVDKRILDYTINHPIYAANRHFIIGEPAAILMVECMASSTEEVTDKANQLIAALQQKQFGYAYPILFNSDSIAAWDIRKAGLGLLRNGIGNVQPVNLIEDCAVAPADLPDYIEEVQLMLKRYNVEAAYYAHAGAGELHIEPMLNLKSAEGVLLFRSILKDTAALIKKYNGSLSGEHGDGRLRGEFIKEVMGEEVMELFIQVKNIFDPNHIFNAGKIVQTPAMDSHFRMKQDDVPASLSTYFNYADTGTMLQLAEKCSGSGDCRRSAVSTGLMCPSYMATRNEFDTTRARANILRQYLSDGKDANPLNKEAIKEVMDLCLSCKGCKVECPSGVDITKMKAEFLQHYYDANGIPLRARLIGNFSNQMKWASKLPGLYNGLLSNKITRKIINKVIGFHPNRSMPLLSKTTLQSWFTKRQPIPSRHKKVYFFCDEFTNYVDVSIGKKAILLLEHLGYTVIIPTHVESGRTYLSKGMLKKAATISNTNIALLSQLVTADIPLIGIEPSAILTLRDEYKDLAKQALYQQALHLAKHTFTIEEFLYAEMLKGNISKDQFSQEEKSIVLHTHCYQKVLSSSKFSKYILSFPTHYSVTEIASGCCGMAGSFGYEKEHYALSQQVGELVLFPFIRNTATDVIVAAAGTSCRHQVKDATQREALHPVEILYNAIKR